MRRTIYDAHFGFRESPFGLTPDPRFFYSNAVYREALATLAYGLEARRGFIVVAGETGTGKTTLLRRLMRSLEPKFKTAYVFNTLVSFTELLRLILADLELQSSGEDKLELIARLNEYLLEQHKQGYVVALLIDEAQDLSLEILEELRLLTNLETDKEKLLQIALIGQPRLERKLAEPALRQLSQRVALRCRLVPLQAHEVESYITARLQAVSKSGMDLFDREAIEKIALYSKGIPRLINIICDNALLICYAASKSRIDGQTIDEVAADLILEQTKAEVKVPASIKGQPAEKDFSMSVREVHAEAVKNEFHMDGEELRPVSDPPPKPRDRSRTWLQISPALIVIIIGFIALLYPKNTVFLTRESGRSEVTGKHNEIEYAKLSPFARLEYASAIQPASSGRKVSVNALETAKPAVVQSLPSHGNPILQVTPVDKKEFELGRPPRSAKQENSSVGSFDVVAASFVRNKPTSNADIITTLEPGTRIVVERQNGEYYWVRSIGAEPVRGYVHREDAFFERRKNQ